MTVEHAVSPSAPMRSSAVAPGRRRRMATMMPRPTTTSAAATTSTKNTAVWPSMLPTVLDRATKQRLTALSISSMHINITSGLRRTSTPTAPMPNSTAPSTRYHVGGRHGSGRTRSHSRLLLARASRCRRVSTTVPATATTSGHRRELEGEDVVAEQVAAECLMLASRSLGAALSALAGRLRHRGRRHSGPLVARREDGRGQQGDDRHSDDRRQRALDRQRLDLRLSVRSTPRSMITNRNSTTIAPA